LYITLNLYSNRLFNNWNGDLLIDKENNIIAAATMMAGIKDNENRFSGTFIGCVDYFTNNTQNSQLDASKHTLGIYGYH
jgi:hypothetical protein